MGNDCVPMVIDSFFGGIIFKDEENVGSAVVAVVVPLLVIVVIVVIAWYGDSPATVAVGLLGSESILGLFNVVFKTAEVDVAVEDVIWLFIVDEEGIV